MNTFNSIHLCVGKHYQLHLKMKKSLEYKILKHLRDNDNGDFIDLRGFIDDRNKLESKLRSLAKEPEEYITARFPFFTFNAYSSDFTDDTLEAKIEFNGIKYLESLNKPGLTKYQKIYMILFSLFGLFGIYKTLSPTVSASEHQSLQSDYKNLKHKFDSINKLNLKPKDGKLKDTLSSKNSE